MTRTIATWSSRFRRPDVAPSLAAGRVAYATATSVVVSESAHVRTFGTDGTIDRVELSPDGTSVLALLDDGQRAQVWQVADGRRTIDLHGDGGPKSLRAGFFTQKGATLLFATGQRTGAICYDPTTGAERGWINLAGLVVFIPLRIVSLDDDFAALIGHQFSEHYDSLLVVSSPALATDHGAVQAVFANGSGYQESAEYVAVGRCGKGLAVVWRTALVEPGDGVDADDYQCFTGVAVLDLATGKIVQRIATDGPTESGLALIGNDKLIARVRAGGVDLVDRASGKITTLTGANALDPRQMIAARVSVDGHVELIDLTS